MNRYVPLLLACACAPADSALPCPGDDPQPALAQLPPQDAPCVLDVDSPTRLLVTTTDFSTGAVSLVDLETQAIARDVAGTTSDSIPIWHDGLGILINRYQFDSIARLDPERAWASAGVVPIESSCSAAPNPQAIAWGQDGLAYVSNLDVPELAVLDLDAPPASARVGTIDLRAIEDDDGNPDAGLLVACGDTLWVAIQRLDDSYSHVGPDELVPIDLASQRVIDLDPAQDGAQGIVSRGAWIRQLRLDPTDPEGHRVLALSTGIERIDLTAGTAQWLVPPEAFAAAQLGASRQLQAFDVDAEARMAYVAAYDEPPQQVQLYQVALDGGEPAVPVAFADGFDSVERTLELVDDRLWYGSTRRGAPGLWVFDVAVTPPAVVAGPLDTGLPPYSLVAIP